MGRRNLIYLLFLINTALSAALDNVKFFYSNKDFECAYDGISSGPTGAAFCAYDETIPRIYSCPTVGAQCFTTAAACKDVEDSAGTSQYLCEGVNAKWCCNIAESCYTSVNYTNLCYTKYRSPDATEEQQLSILGVQSSVFVESSTSWTTGQTIGTRSVSLLSEPLTYIDTSTSARAASTEHPNVTSSSSVQAFPSKVPSFTPAGGSSGVPSSTSVQTFPGEAPGNTSATASGSTNEAALQSGPSSPGSSVSGGTVAGTVVGVATAIGVVAGIVWYTMSRKARSSTARAQDPTTAPSQNAWAFFVSPAIMFASLLTGIVLAAGHHFFYANLAGTDTPDGTYTIAWRDVPKQSFNTAVGTTFAFLVKAALAVSVWIAYTQLFWRSVRRSNKGESLTTLDTMFSISQDLISFAKVGVWVKYPVMLTLALVAWQVDHKMSLIPLAALVTPSTLSVESTATSKTASLKVPKFDFTNFAFISPPTLGNKGIGEGYLNSYDYRGPSRAVSRIVSAVAAQGEILAIKPPALNASWDLDFYGPDLRCNSVSAEQRYYIEYNIWEFYMSTAAANTCASSWSYIAWVPMDDKNVPFLKPTITSTNGRPAKGSWSYPKSLDPHLPFGRPATLMLAVLPGMFSSSIELPTHTLPAACAFIDVDKDTTFEQASQKDLNGYTIFQNSTLLECQVYNTSLAARFKYVDGDQRVVLTRDPKPSDKLLVAHESVTGPPGQYLDDRFTPNEHNASCSTLNLSGKFCDFQEELLRTLSYQAIMDAFNRLVQGTIGMDNSPVAPGVEPQTNLYDTILMNSNELAFLQTSTAIPASNPSLPDLLAESRGSKYPGLGDEYTTRDGLPLAKALEQLFQNITVSLLNENLPRPNSTSIFAPHPKANVTITRVHNIYTYAEKTLWLAYGIAIAFTIVAVGIGTTVLVLSGASYTNSFSTIVRVSRAGILSEEVSGTDGDGTQPLPKHLSNSRLSMRGGKEASIIAEAKEPEEGDRSSQGTSLLSPGGDATDFHTDHGSTTALEAAQGRHDERRNE